MEMIKSWFIKIGIQRSIIFLVLMAILFSLSITIPIVVLTGGDITIPGLIATIVTPGVTATIFSIVAIRLLFDLDLAEQKYKELSRMDDVTGINNRRYFLEMAERELDRAKRYGVEFSLVMFDINEFKLINDQFGHLVGDKMLREIAQQCRVRIRNTDYIARWGGDEFVVLVAQSENVDLDQYCNRILDIISKIHLIEDYQSIRVTASIGAKRYTDEIFSIDEMIHWADRDMYQIRGKERFQW